MADRKVEPVEHKDELQPISSQNHPKDAQSTSSVVPEGTQPPARTSSVRNTVLDEVVANQDKQIAELERKVEKKKETIRKLSLPSPYIPPPGLSVVTPHIPPSTVPQASAPLTSPVVRPQANKPGPSPSAANTANSSQQQPHHSQPLAHNPAMAATVAAMAAASTPVSTALHPHFSFFPYPHPDNHVMTFGVVPTLPPHPAAQPLQPPNSATPSQPNQSSDDGTNRQSRYWTPDEHQRFLAGRRTYGPRNYQQIAEVVGTRNAKQVRTHSQKYQQKLEREEARRRGDGRVSSDVHSGVRAVAPKVTASSDGNATLAPNQTRQSDVHRNGTGPVSGKNSQSNEAPHSSKSAEGSSNANNGSSEATAENSINAVHLNAAARAVAAEAVALSRGTLPPGAIVMLEKPRVDQSQSCNPKTQPIRPKGAIAVKDHNSQTRSAPTRTNITGSMVVAKSENQSASRQPSKHNNDNSPCVDAPVTTSIPLGSGESPHHATESEHQKEVTNKKLANASSRVQLNPSVNGTSTQMQQSADKKANRKQGRSAVKIEPRAISSTTKLGPSMGSNHEAQLVTHSNLTTPIKTKPTVSPVTETVKANGCVGRIEEKVQRSVIEAKPAEVVKTEDNRDVCLSNNNSLAAQPVKRILPNGQRPYAKPSEVKSGEESQSSKKRDSPRSLKSNSSVEVHCDSGSPPRPNGSARTSNRGKLLDTGDIKERTEKSVAIPAKKEEGAVKVLHASKSNSLGGTIPKGLTEKKTLPPTEAVQTQDESAACFGTRESVVICTDKRKVKDARNNVECRPKDEMQASLRNKEIALSSTLNERIPNGGGNVGDAQKLEDSGNDTSTKASRALDPEASQERRRGDDVENIAGAETKGGETRIGRVLPDGEARKDSENGKASSNNGDEVVGEEESDGSEQAEEKVDGAGQHGVVGQRCDQAVKRKGDRQDMKRRIEDMTESGGKRQKVWAGRGDNE